ncbi:MAG: hypothetical protein KDF59_12595 [Nitrosomonas sp.]|nr:hypothetical protein [Nitrosomonas sp.]
MSKGPKNQETDQFLTSSGNGAQYSETGGRCNCGNHPYRQSSEAGGFLLVARLRNASQIWSEEEIEGAEWKFDGKPMGSIRFRDILSHQVQPPDAENRMSGGVGEVTGAIPSPRPDPAKAASIFFFLSQLSSQTSAKTARHPRIKYGIQYIQLPNEIK